MKMVKDAMTRKVESTKPTMNIVEAANIMKKHNIGLIPVVDAEKLVGTVTDRDIVVRGVADKTDMTKVKVSDVMTNKVDICYEDQDIEEVTKRMKQKLIRRVVVVDRNDKLTGVISLGDLTAHTDEKTSGEVLRQISQSDKS